MKKDRLTIGKIFNVHGIRGEVKVLPLTDDVSRFSTLKNCFIGDREFKVKKTRLNKKHVIIKLEGVDDRDSAERFKNRYMEVDRKDSVPLEEGEYFIEDLKGIDVIDEEGNLLGTFSDVITNAAVDVYVFDIDGREQMIAALEENVIEIKPDEYIKIKKENLVY